MTTTKKTPDQNIEAAIARYRAAKAAPAPALREYHDSIAALKVALAEEEKTHDAE